MKKKIEYPSYDLDVESIFMRHTSKNPIQGDIVGEMLGIDKRLVAASAARLQKRGRPVCSNGEGYYWGTATEFFNHLEKERKRAIKINNKIEQAKKNYMNEETLFDAPVNTPPITPTGFTE